MRTPLPRALLQCWLWLWASPWTLLGLVIGVAGLAGGGGVQRVGTVLEFHGGFVTWFLRHVPLVKNAVAVTFGHTVLAVTAAELDRTRNHERVHVRQYEWWGPFFVPAYIFWWIVRWFQGRHPYLDNPFEEEAYREAP